MLIQKNRTIARQRRQISWLILFILLGITWVYSLKEDVYNLKSEKYQLNITISQKDTLIVQLIKNINLLKNKPVSVPIIDVKRPKKIIKKDTIVKSIDTTSFSKKDSL